MNGWAKWENGFGEMDNNKPPSRGSGSKPKPDLDQVLSQEWRERLAMRLVEAYSDTGHGKITIVVYKKSVVGIDITKTDRGSNNEG